MSEEHEAPRPYKCAVCGAKFDSQDQLQNHLKSCTQKNSGVSPRSLSDGRPTQRPVIRTMSCFRFRAINIRTVLGHTEKFQLVSEPIKPSVRRSLTTTQ